MTSKYFSALVVAVLAIAPVAGHGSPPPHDGALAPAPAPATVPAHNPVVFVHGWRGSAAAWQPMMRNFINAGWSPDQLFAISLSDPNSGAVGINIKHAAEIRDYIKDTVLPQTGASRVDIIAHSMGGLSTMYYLHALGGAVDGEVTDVVCLDCGVQGSTQLLILLAIPDFRQSTQAVRTVRTHDQTPAGILADPDGTPHVPGDMTYTFLWHTDSINQLDGGVSQQWPSTSHNQFLTDPDVFRAVEAAVIQNMD